MSSEPNPTNAGFVDVNVVDPVQGAPIPTRLLYPTHAPRHSESIGPYTLAAARDAAPEGAGLPLVVISHGNGASGLVHRDLAVGLASAGFAVALLDHPGNRRGDDALAGTAANLRNRPRHIRLVIDAVLTHPVLGPHLQHERVGLLGQSIGAYTVLAAAGGRPSTFAHESPDGVPHPIDVTPDPRVRALVLLTPAAGWFIPDGSLSDVDLPILLWTAEHDVHTPVFHAEIIERGVRDRARIERRVLPDAAHFSFHSPFPPAMVRPEFAPSQDPPGFDRAAFQPVLQEAVTSFFRRTLGAS